MYFLNSKFISTHPPRRGGVDMDIYIFYFLAQKSSVVSFLHFGDFKEDKGAHPKRNEQQRAQNSVGIDIFVKNESHRLWRLKNCLISTVPIFYPSYFFLKPHQM